MRRSLKIFWVLLVTVGLIGFMGSNSLLMASHVTHFVSDKGPKLPQNETGCVICHAAGNLQCDPSGPLFADSTPEEPRDLNTTTVCDPCHSPGGAYDGVDDPVIGAKANWTNGVYNAGGKTLKDGKEKWCAGCHDDVGAIIDGPGGSPMQAKQVTGDDDGTGGGVYGYFINGHGFKCTECHDASIRHIDDEDRTYHAEKSQIESPDYDPDRTYQKGYRLALVDGEDPLVIPRKYPGAGPHYESSMFRLCYRCHCEARVVGEPYSYLLPFGAPLETCFANLSERGVQTTTVGSPPTNHHVSYHLDAAWPASWDSDNRMEEIGGNGSDFSCTTCHDPHSKVAYENRPTPSMTRKDLGVFYDRDDEGWFAVLDTDAYRNPGGDLHCFGCHDSSNRLRYYFQLGTALAKDQNPAFYTTLDSKSAITSPEFCVVCDGGTLLNPVETEAFDEYKICEGEVMETEATGLLIDAPGEGCMFPFGENGEYNVNPDQEVIDFWYVPKFDFSENSQVRFLVHGYYNSNNNLQIKVTTGSNIYFHIKHKGDLYKLKSKTMHWEADTRHHIRCTWGPNGMHMYLDGEVEEYNVDSGTAYGGGLNKNKLPECIYIGQRQDGTDPAGGIIDEFKMYGFQYQKDLAFWSKMGSAGEIENPAIGDSGTVSGTSFASGEHGLGLLTNASYKGVAQFPGSIINATADTIDFWYEPQFDFPENSDTKKFMLHIYKDDNHRAILKVYNKKILFRIYNESVQYQLITADLDWTSTGDNSWHHIVCSWGEHGMHLYLDGQEAGYSDDSGKGYDGSICVGCDPADYVVRIGNKEAGVNYYANAIIDEVRIYGYQETSFPLAQPYKEPVP